MKEIGAVLYEARTEQGLTLEELSERTRIRVDYLKAVEEGNPEKVPGEAYFRAFIRTYAREVALDPEELLVRYEMGKMPEAAQLEPAVPAGRPSLRERRAAKRRRRRIRFLATTAVLLAAAAAAYWLWSSGMLGMS